MSTQVLILFNKTYTIKIGSFAGQIYMKHTSKKIHPSHSSHLFFPVGILFLLMIGIVVSLVQIQQQQELRQRAASPTGVSQECTVNDTLIASTAAEQALFDQINVYRQQQNLQPFAWSPVLKKAATWMSTDMLINDKLAHIDSLGREIATRLTICGYPQPALFGENIDNGTDDVTTVLNSWKHSQPHNNNLLSNTFTEIGISLATGSAVTQSYWTVNFAGVNASPSATVTPSATPSGSISPSISPSISATPSSTILPTVALTKLPTQITPTTKPTNVIVTIKTPTVPVSPTGFPGYVPNPLDTQLLVSAKIPSIGNSGNKSPRNKTRSVEVAVFDAANQQVAKKSGVLTYDGNLFTGVIHLGTVSNGTYYIKIISPFNLQALVQPQFQVLRNDRLNSLPQVTFIQGDLTNNNILTIEDYNIALACFQDQKCVVKAAIDFNDDGIANVTDYNLLLQNFWEYRGD